MSTASPGTVSETLPTIRGHLATSLNEFYGRIATVLFLPGCNWRCPFCHGWRFVREPERLAAVPIEAVLEQLDDQAGWVDGAVVTGGEPTLHTGLPALLSLLRDQGLDTKLETNGSHPEVLRALIDEHLLDSVALDFKATLTPERLSRAVGVDADPEAVRESFRLVAASDLDIEFHTTLCPAAVTLEDLPGMAEDIQRLAPRATWILQRYNPDEVLDPQAAGPHTYEGNEVRAVVEQLRQTHPAIDIRGF